MVNACVTLRNFRRAQACEWGTNLFPGRHVTGSENLFCQESVAGVTVTKLRAPPTLDQLGPTSADAMLTADELADIQADCMADDVELNLEKMTLWTRDQAVAYFESGGEVEPPPPIKAFTAAHTKGSRPTGATKWLACLQKKPEPTKRIVVVSWTGNRGGQGSAHNIRRVPLNWSQTAADDVEIYEVSLPGRGTRVKEPLFTDVRALVEEMARELGDALKGGPPYAIIGFAFGAILAYEVSRAIAEASGRVEGPALLVACSCEAPAWAERAGKQHTLDEAAFLAMLKQKGGTGFILKDAGLTKM